MEATFLKVGYWKLLHTFVHETTITVEYGVLYLYYLVNFFFLMIPDLSSCEIYNFKRIIIMKISEICFGTYRKAKLPNTW